jgi:hypothetical protein
MYSIGPLDESRVISNLSLAHTQGGHLFRLADPLGEELRPLDGEEVEARLARHRAHLPCTNLIVTTNL